MQKDLFIFLIFLFLYFSIFSIFVLLQTILNLQQLFYLPKKI